MAEKVSKPERARMEAAEWFARLNSRTITTQAILDFREWRNDPRNAAAYASLDTLWRAANGLSRDPHIQDAVRAAMERQAKGRKLNLPDRRTTSFGVIALIGLLTFGALGFLSLGTSYATPVGEQRLVRLEDGSRIRLDTDTRLKVRFTKGERHIELGRGRALFEVAHDTSRPFVVSAGKTDVRALGTRFDVRRDDQEVDVTLIDGSVRVGGEVDGSATWTLKPGEQLTLTENHAAAQARKVDISAATSWTSGRLVFHSVPLASALAEVNRYSRRKIVLEDAELAATPVTGVFDTGDTEAFVAAVADLYDLTPVRRQDGAIRLTTNPKRAPS